MYKYKVEFMFEDERGREEVEKVFKELFKAWEDIRVIEVTG